MNILFSCVGRRNYLLRYFRESLSKNDKIFATDMQRTAPGMMEADYPIVVPSIYDSNYISVLKSICVEHKINAIISLNDLELPILSKEKHQFDDLGTQVIVSDPAVIDLTFDKLKTAEWLESIGLHTPKTVVSYQECLKLVNDKELEFPLVVKPRWGSASIGIEFPEDREELELVYKLSQIKLKRTILGNVSGEDIDHALLFQEKIGGKEYGVDVLNDFNGNYVGTYVREKLAMRSGETDKARTVIDERFEKIGRAISSSLKHIGNLDCDILESEGELYVLELNPRFGGGYPFSHEGGAKGTACYVSWLKGLDNVTEHLRYDEGKIFSKCDRLMKITF